MPGEGGGDLGGLRLWVVGLAACARAGRGKKDQARPSVPSVYVAKARGPCPPRPPSSG